MVSYLNGSIRSTKVKIDALASSLADGGRPAAKQPSSGHVSNSGGIRSIVHGENALWPVVHAPLSRFTEAIRTIKLAIDLNGAIKPSQTIGLTSSLPSEGKSTIAIALAQLMSQVGKRTILVDCDLRNPATSRTLAPDASSGLLEVIQGTALLEDAVWTDPTINLSFLPVVVRSRLAHSNEILGSDPTKKLFDRLRESYDYVVVDLPPLAPIVDVRAVAHLIDSFIYVIEWGRTRIDVVDHALGGAPVVYENLLGAVLNKVDMNVFRRFASGHEDYYYNKHYAQYGYTE